MNRHDPVVTRALSLAATLLVSGVAVGQSTTVEDSNRHYDARIEHNRGFHAPRALARVPSALGLAASDLSIETDETTGVVRSIAPHTGYLTRETAGSPMSVAMDFVRKNLATLGLKAADLAGYEVTDVVPSAVTGATHIYLRQRLSGVPVYNAQIHVNVNRDGRIISVNNSFLPDLAQSVKTLRPRLELPAAVQQAMKFAGQTLAAEPMLLQQDAGPQRASRVEHAGLSRAPIDGRLMLLPIRQGEAKLVWNFQIHTLDKQSSWDLTVDADSGRVWTRADWTLADSYRVYPLPAESPNHVSPLPPADGRVLLTNPANSLASPFGWHDTNGAAGAELTTTQGNNVQAYTDTDNNNSPDAGSSPSGGAGLVFDFAEDLTQTPSAYRPAAVTNLFYITNYVHDVQYQYGFDEVSGNFQVDNYGRGGAGNDSLQAEAQDGGGTNNANFSTPPDGSRPRMQMYVWTAPTPDRDGDLDAGIVVHEYGHGISTRLVGGPSNSSCLTNNQQPGEGLSDWWALAYTARVGDTGPMGRGLGTYALNQPTTGAGIRTQRYSTNPSINTWTYASINGMAIPHGVGSVWAEAAWKVYWKLVDQWGFDPNLYNATGGAGNQRMMLYVNEGMKNTACNPTFTQVRDGILQAAADNHGGEDVCRMWEAFAAFGLGTNAVSGGASSTAPTNGFNVPASCAAATPTATSTATPRSTPTPRATSTPTPTPRATVTPTPTPAVVVVFQDDFETDKGWVTNASGTDTATTGQWERGNPEGTTSDGVKQLDVTSSGVNDLVTGRLAGASPGANDIDGGTTSILSPAIPLPATGTLTLTFNQYLAHGSNATSADFLRVVVVGTTTSVVFERLGAAVNLNGAWAPATASLNAFAGQTVRIRIEAADAGTASLVEAGIDDVKITRQ
jgi:extracellular elastinolytic metalloproteinase